MKLLILVVYFYASFSHPSAPPSCYGSQAYIYQHKEGAIRDLISGKLSGHGLEEGSGIRYFISAKFIELNTETMDITTSSIPNDITKPLKTTGTISFILFKNEVEEFLGAIIINLFANL